MRERQQQIMKALYVLPEIDAAEEIRKRVGFMKAYLLQCGFKALVLGISGGQDSALAGKLAQLSVEELRHETGDDAYRFIAVRLPYGVQNDENDAGLAIDFIQPDQVCVFNIRGATDAVVSEFSRSAGHAARDYDKGNVKARIRMVAQYLLAASAGQGLVVGTDHAAEAVTGFFTKFGDGAADLTPLTGLTKRQGKQLLIRLQAPNRLYEKMPTADLLDDQPGQADEAELGVTYEQLDDYLEGKSVPDDVAERIEKCFDDTRHKREQPVSPFDGWWKEGNVNDNY